MPDDKDKRTPLQAVRDVWMALTGVISSAESEVQKRFHDTLGLPPDANVAQELMSRVRKNREEFERRVDEGVKAAVAKVRAPIDKEIAQLKQRVEKLQERIEAEKQKRKKS
jgi:hypothetical protein